MQLPFDWFQFKGLRILVSINGTNKWRRTHRWFIWVHLRFIPQVCSLQYILHRTDPEAIHPFVQPETNDILQNSNSMTNHHNTEERLQQWKHAEDHLQSSLCGPSGSSDSNLAPLWRTGAGSIVLGLHRTSMTCSQTRWPEGERRRSDLIRRSNIQQHYC